MEIVKIVQDGIELDVNDALNARVTSNETDINATNLRIDNLVIPISPENANIEVTDSHNSVVKNKNFPSLKARLEESESEFAEHKLDYIEQRQQDNLKIAKVEKNINDYKSTLSQVNVNQEAKQDVSGYGIVSLPKNTANGQVSARLEGITATNLIRNGNFINTNNWTSNTANLSASNNVLSATGNGIVNSADTRQDTESVLRNGDKYYVSSNFKVTNSDATHILIQVPSVATVIRLDNPVQNQLYNLKGIITIGNQIGTFSLSNRTYYLDATTQTGKTTELSNILAINLTQTFGAGNEPTVEECDKIFANYFDGTKSTISASRLKSVGKNLFDTFSVGEYSSKLPSAHVDNFKYTNGGFSFTSKINASSYIAVPLSLIPNTVYLVSAKSNKTSGINGGGIRVWEDINGGLGKPIGGSSNNPILSFNSGLSGKVFVLFYAKDAFSELIQGVEFTDIQIEEGTVATTYEPYTESTQYLPNVGELRSLPSGVRDEIRVSGGKAELIKRVSGEVVLDGSEDWKLWRPKELNTGFYLPKAYVENIMESNGVNVSSSEMNGVDYVYIFSNDEPYLISSYHRNSETYGLFITLPNSIADTPTKCKQWLQTNPVTVVYQLAEPEIIPIQVSGNIVSNPSGTIYIEPYTTVAGIYNSNISILSNELPIASIDKISKIDFTTGNETMLDVSKTAIDVNKLSFTHPDLADGDIVFFEYMYPQEATTLGESTIEYFDSRYTIKDSIVPNKFYKWELTVANGIPAINLVEVL